MNRESNWAKLAVAKKETGRLWSRNVIFLQEGTEYNQSDRNE